MIGEKFKYLRNQKKMSMETLANEFNKKYDKNVSKSMISSWENGRYYPSKENIQLYSDYFSAPYFYLVDDDIDFKSLLFSQAFNKNLFKSFYSHEEIKKWLESYEPERKDINDKIYFNIEKLNLEGLKKVKEYSEDLASNEKYKRNDLEDS